MSEKEVSKLVEYWRANIATNYKKISAVLGSMLIMVIGLALYGFKTGLDGYTILMTMVFAVNPFLTILINIMFKGETELKDKEIVILKKDLEFNREISEYKIQLAGLKANADWVKFNDMLAEVDKIEKKVEVPVKTTQATTVYDGTVTDTTYTT